MFGRRVAALWAGIMLSTSGSLASGTAADVVVQINGVRSNDGFVRLAVYDPTGDFPSGSPVVGTDIAAAEGTTVVRLPELPHGRYAIAFYHDEDGNAEFGQNFIGLPTEGYGFSNDAAVVLGPPSFDEAAIEVSGTVVTTARMRY